MDVRLFQPYSGKRSGEGLWRRCPFASHPLVMLVILLFVEHFSNFFKACSLVPFFAGLQFPPHRPSLVRSKPRTAVVIATPLPLAPPTLTIAVAATSFESHRVVAVDYNAWPARLTRTKSTSLI